MTPGETAPLSLTIFLVLLLTFIRANVVEINATATQNDPRSLQYHLCGAGAAQLSSNTTLVLSEGTHMLEEDQFCVIQNLSNITIQGQGQFDTQIKCVKSGNGIFFFDISTLLVLNLEITNCGGYIFLSENDSFVYLVDGQKAAVIISSSIDITIKSVTIFNCTGFGVLLFNVLGSTVFDKVQVNDNNPYYYDGYNYYDDDYYDLVESVGNGIAFVYDDSEFTAQLVKSGVNYTSLTIVNTSFYNNSNYFYDGSVDKLFDILLNGITKQPIPLTGGLSIAVYSAQRDYYVDININNTDIVGNLGNVPNLFVVHYDTITTTKTRLDQVNFTNNYNGDGRGSGFFLLVTIFYDSLSTQGKSDKAHTIASVFNSNFTGNYAQYYHDTDGTVICFITPQNIIDIYLIIKDTIFTNNFAGTGSAVTVIQLQSFVNNRNLYVYLEDITATANRGSDDFGVFFFSQASNVTVIGTEPKGCMFYQNFGSVVFSEGTNITLKGVIEFTENFGFRGGAMRLVFGSILYFHRGSYIRFTQNVASAEGGAIFIDSTTTSTMNIKRPIKFIGSKKQVPNIIFTNNSAVTSGNSIYGKNIYDCCRDVFREFNITPVGNGHSEINSQPHQICILNDSTLHYVRYNERYCQYEKIINEPVVPGSYISLYLVPLDTGMNPVFSYLYSSLQSSDSVDGVSLGPGQNLMQLPGVAKFTRVDFQIFAPENLNSISLSLSVLTESSESVVTFNTTSCPAGFDFDYFDRACTCNDFILSTLGSYCYKGYPKVYRRPSQWIGTETNGNKSSVVFANACPINYCNKTLTYVDLTIQDHVCVEGRTGRICGACKGKLSSLFGVADCRQCSNAWLATLILFALVGILQVIFYFLLDFTITHGLINGLFFYSNIVIVNSSILFRENERGVLFWYVSWLNLDLGFPMCFYNGMTESAKAGLQYVYPTYLILIIILIIILSQHLRPMQRLFSQLSGIHVLVSIFYISFLKLFPPIIDSLFYVTVVSEDGEDQLSWVHDGKLKISDSLAIFLIILASVALLFGIVPYILFFTFYALIQRWITSTKINAFVDANLAPYKHSCRYWFGARLLLTMTIYAIIVTRDISNPSYTLILELSFLVGFSIVQAYIRPFKSQTVSLIDLSILINLILLILGTSYTIQDDERNSDQIILVRVSMSVVFITNIGIILGHLLMVLRKIYQKMDIVLGKFTKIAYNLKLRKWKAILNIIKNREKQEEGENNRSRQDDLTGLSGEGPSSTTVSLQDLGDAKVKRENTLHQSGSQLREPLLGSLDDENTLTA